MSLKALQSPAWDPEDTSLWKMDECATFLGITKGALYHVVERGEIPCVRFGARIHDLQTITDAPTLAALEAAPAARIVPYL